MDTPLLTPRLHLRRLTSADGDNLYRLDSDPRVMRYINGGQPHSQQHIQNVMLPGFLRCNADTAAPGFVAALQRGTGRFLGWFHLRPTTDGTRELELGYRLLYEVWGQGLATEGSRTLVQHAFTTLDTERIIALALRDNHASIRVMEKVGLRFEKELIEPTTGLPAVAPGTAPARMGALISPHALTRSACPMAAIHVGRTGMEVNNRPVMNLHVHTKDGRKVGMFTQRDDEEIRWIASLLRTTLGVPAHPSGDEAATAVGI